jgi:putative FmdB family regulatory protein
MPLYTYKCECGYQFEDLQRMSERHQAECIVCGKFAKQKIDAPRLDPTMDTPGARMTQRRKMEERGRGRDMWHGNRQVADESILREAHAKRVARGEHSITTSGKKEA